MQLLKNKFNTPSSDRSLMLAKIQLLKPVSQYCRMNLRSKAWLGYYFGLRLAGHAVI